MKELLVYFRFFVADNQANKPIDFLFHLLNGEDLWTEALRLILREATIKKGELKSLTAHVWEYDEGYLRFAKSLMETNRAILDLLDTVELHGDTLESIKTFPDMKDDFIRRFANNYQY